MTNFSAVKQFFRPLTDEQVLVLVRKHAGTPGIEQSVYLDEVGLEDLAIEVFQNVKNESTQGFEHD